jgi:hypothetical protein
MDPEDQMTALPLAAGNVVALAVRPIVPLTVCLPTVEEKVPVKDTLPPAAGAAPVRVTVKIADAACCVVGLMLQPVGALGGVTLPAVDGKLIVTTSAFAAVTDELSVTVKVTGNEELLALPEMLPTDPVIVSV